MLPEAKNPHSSRFFYDVIFNQRNWSGTELQRRKHRYIFPLLTMVCAREREIFDTVNLLACQSSLEDLDSNQQHDMMNGKGLLQNGGRERRGKRVLSQFNGSH